MSEPLPPNPAPELNVPITPELIQKHGLLPAEYEQIKGILGREPTLTELGVFSVMWSEHCSYKNSRLLLRGFPMEKKDPNALGKVLVRAGEENAGVIDIGDGWAICFKIESHNHPSAVEPFEGAATGVGGIIRDIFTMGARPVLLTNSLRFGDIRHSAQSRRLLRGVVAGISHYGNCIGIPDVGGDIYFDKSYEGNPLVNALCLGVLRHDQIKRGAATGIGNPVYYVGPATGRDGLGGAAFASKELSETSSEDRPAVQKGDPFMEKLLLEACLELMAVPGLVVGIQDMGAAGLTCSTAETASRGHSGIQIELDKVPQRETGMNSYEIMLSESQERMLVIVTKGREKEIEDIFKKWDLHAVQIGEVTADNDMVVTHHGIEVVRIPANRLADDAPLYMRDSKEPAHLAQMRAWEPSSLPKPDKAILEKALPRLLNHPTIAQKKWIWRQYDHMVIAGTVLAPGTDAAVARLRLEGTEKYVAIANDCNNAYCKADPKKGAALAVVECLQNLACSGARALGITDNLNFGNPYKPESFYYLKEAILGLAEACTYFDVPVTGGNVSLYNENSELAIDPTPVVSIAGLVDDPKHITTQWAGRGQSLVLLGDWPCELGQSMYLQELHDLKTGPVPALDFAQARETIDLTLALIKQGLVKAAHDLSEGGLLCAVAEMCFGKEETIGAELDLSMAPQEIRRDALLYGEGPARIIIASDKPDGVLAAAQAAGVPARIIGQTTDKGSDLCIKDLGICWDAKALRKGWETAIPSLMDA